MTPRARRYFAIKEINRHLTHWMGIAHAMIELTKPIPKYPPGTIHAGGPAFVGESLGPEIVFGPDGIALAVAKHKIRPLPNCDIIPEGLIDNKPLRMPVSEVKKIIAEQNMPDLVAKAVKDAYTRLPDFGPGGVKKT